MIKFRKVPYLVYSAQVTTMQLDQIIQNHNVFLPSGDNPECILETCTLDELGFQDLELILDRPLDRLEFADVIIIFYV